MKYLALLALFIFGSASGQIRKRNLPTPDSDTLVVDTGNEKDSVTYFNPTIQDFRFKTEKGDYQLFDTVFTAEKIFTLTQFNNRDNFGKLTFSNIGQTFNPLTYESRPDSALLLLPQGKSYGIIPEDQMEYYDVKSPTTSFIYHNPVREGAVLQSTYSQNIGKQFNFTVGYRGLRSKGNYRRELAVNNNFNLNFHYISPNERYEAYAHFLNQKVDNEENGGIQDLEQFLGGDSRFNNRQNIEVNLTGAKSEFTYRRYYLSHDYGLFRIDEAYPIRIRHRFKYEYSKYYFDESNPESFFMPDDDSLIPGMLPHSRKYSYKLTNNIGLAWDKEQFKLDAALRYENVKLGTDEVFNGLAGIPVEWTDNRIGVEGNLAIKLWNRFDLNSHAEYTTGKRFGNLLNLQNSLSAQLTDAIAFRGKLDIETRAPGLNFLMNGSMYRPYNFVFSDFKNETVLHAGGEIGLKWFDTKLYVNYYNLGNFAYFDEDYQPQQASSLNVTQFGGETTLKSGHFNLNLRAQIQSTLNGDHFLPLPNFVGRAAVYYQNKAFQKVAEYQVGVKSDFFSKFNSRQFSPILNEFVLSRDAFSIGGKPTLDGFINFKVKSMMFFVEAQNLQNIITRNKSFVAPLYPFIDFRLNLGIVWYIFS